MKASTKGRAVKTIDFTRGNMAKNVACFALPLLCANLVQLLYSATDALFAGNVEGTAGIAAIGASSLAVMCMVSFLSGFSVGSNVLVASKHGAKDEEGLRRVFGTSILLALLLGALFCVVGIACSDALVGLMAVPESVHDDALSYLRIYFLALPFVALYDNVASCLRGMGDSRTPLYAQIIGGIINVALDAVALLVLSLGIDGVAWATFFSQGIAFLFAFLRARSMLKVRPAIRSAMRPAADLAMRQAQELELQLAPRLATGAGIKPAARPSTQSATRPATQLAVRPVTQPATRPAAQSAVQPAAKPAAPPAGQSAAQPAAKPTIQSAVQPAAKPTVQSSVQPATCLDKALICMDFAIAKEIFAVGFPVAIQALCVTLSNTLIQVAINATGETNVAAFTAYFKIETLIYAPLVALGQTATVLAAQNVGAKYHWRVHRGVRCCIAFGAVFAVVVAAVLLVFRSSVVALFDQNAEVVAAGGLVVLISFPFYWIYAFIEVYAGVCRGIGRAKEATLITLFCFVAMRLMLLLLVQHCGFGLAGIAAIYPLTWLIAAFFLGFYYYVFAHKELHPTPHGGCRE